MINTVLRVIKEELQQFINLKLHAAQTSEKVVLTSIVDQQGESTIPIDSVGISLYRIVEDRISETEAQNRASYSLGKAVETMPPVRLNLEVLFAANFKNYEESLKHISCVVAFFQSRNYFDAASTPTLPQDMSPVSMTLITQSVDQHNHTWSIYGGRYMPSVIYNLRAVYIQEEAIIDKTHLVEDVRLDAKEKL